MVYHSIIDSEMQEGIFKGGDGCGTIEALHDEHFGWKDKRRKCIELSSLYERAGDEYARYAHDIADCGTYLEYDLSSVTGDKRLHRANFCRVRLCPLCTARLARRRAGLLSKVMDIAEVQYGCRYIFLTLAVRNCFGGQLRGALGDLQDGWRRLCKARSIERAFKGWFRALEITYNCKERTYHPHIHAIVAVEPYYFRRDKGLYITQYALIRYWRRAMRLDYEPTANIKATYDGRGGVGSGTDRASRPASYEAAKYSTKDSDYLGRAGDEVEAIEVLRTYTDALRGKRMIAYGGLLKPLAKALGADKDDDKMDLVHDDDGVIRDDIFDLRAIYGWSFGLGEHILWRVEPNPNFGKSAIICDCGDDFEG